MFPPHPLPNTRRSHLSVFLPLLLQRIWACRLDSPRWLIRDFLEPRVRLLRAFEIYERHYQAATNWNCWSCLSGYRGDYSLRHRAIAFTSPRLVGHIVNLFGRADSCGFCDSFSEFLAAWFAKSETHPRSWHLVLHHFYRTCVRCRSGIIYFPIVRIRAAQHFAYSKWVWVWTFSLVISYDQVFSYCPLRALCNRWHGLVAS